MTNVSLLSALRYRPDSSFCRDCCAVVLQFFGFRTKIYIPSWLRTRSSSVLLLSAVHCNCSNCMVEGFRWEGDGFSAGQVIRCFYGVTVKTLHYILVSSVPRAAQVFPILTKIFGPADQAQLFPFSDSRAGKRSVRFAMNCPLPFHIVERK
jgi:hypothetical protein